MLKHHMVRHSKFVVCVLAIAVVGIVLLSLQRSENAVEKPQNQALQIEVGNQPLAGNNADGHDDQAIANLSDTLGANHESQTAVFEATFGDPEVLRNITETLHDELVTTVGYVDADFVVGLSKMDDWEEIKTTINNKGGDNRDLLMRYGLRSGQISTNEIVDLVHGGAAIPPAAILDLVGKLPIDEILSMQDQGVPIDVTYQNPYSGKNALGQFIVQAGNSPEKYEADEIASTLRKLIRAGVEFSPQGVEKTPLDYALKRVNENNSDQKVAIVKILLQHGVVFEQHHKELLNKMPNGPEKDKLLRLL